MKGYKEILVSFAIGLGSLLAIHQVQEARTPKERVKPNEPTVLQGRSEDPNLSLSWGLNMVRAREAWHFEKGSKDIIVAVIDTGCDVHHPDLIENIWSNPGEAGIDENGHNKATNGVDDDQNGLVDDFHGWNFVNNNPDVMDEHGHGTHIAGVISGKSGVAPGVSLMILKYYDEMASGEQNLRNTVNAIHYAVRMGAKIINYSGGGILRSREEEEALKWAEGHGVLIVAAAGNEGLNSDFFHFYPADYDLPNILSVGAIDRNSQILNISNFGQATVDISAPGKNIYSTLPGGMHGFMTGTSQATAFVSGVSALLMSKQPDLRKPSALIRHLLSRTHAKPQLRGLSRSEAILDAELALKEDTLKSGNVYAAEEVRF